MMLMQIMRQGGRIRKLGFLGGSGCLGVGLGVTSSSFVFLYEDEVTMMGDSGEQGEPGPEYVVSVQSDEIVDSVGEFSSSAASTSMMACL